MDDRKMEIIKELMSQLESEMGHSEDDFSSRLGREKSPAMAIEIDSDEPMDGDDEMAMDGEEPMGPGEELKQRLLKLRG